MTGKTHLAAGLCISLATTACSLDSSEGVLHIPYTDPLYVIPIGMACCIVGSLFPDIDWQTSKIGQVIAPVSKIINMLFGHRTLFHSPLLLALLFVIVRYGFPDYAWFALLFLFGAASHLFLDMLNAKGIPLFYPYEKRFHILRLKQNGIAETMIRKILLGGSVAAGIAFVVTFIMRLKVIF